MSFLNPPQNTKITQYSGNPHRADLPDSLHWDLARRAALGILVGSALCLFGHGCAAPLAGVAVDAAGPAVEKSDQLLRAGKTEAHQAVPIEQAILDVRKAANDLALKPVREEKHPDQLKLIYKDDRDQEYTVTVVRRTANMTEIRVDVGLFGVEGTGRLMMKQILAELPSNSGKIGTPGADASQVQAK